MAASAMVLGLLACAVPARGAPAPVLQVQGAARQGGALFVTVRGWSRSPDASASATPSLRWLDVDYPLAWDGDVLRAVLPIAVSTRPGAHPLLLRADGAEVPRVVTVRKAHYGHQSIWLPAAMLATYDSPAAKADDRRLLEAARIFTPERCWRGRFRLPANGPLTTRYGLARTYNGWRKGWHKGLDIAAWTGDIICAPGGAVVAIVAPGMRVNGNATLLNHGLGVYSLYMHQSRIGVRVGQAVAKGQIIGRVGSTGAGTGPHLHWACYAHGIPIDPQVLLHAPW